MTVFILRKSLLFLLLSRVSELYYSFLVLSVLLCDIYSIYCILFVLVSAYFETLENKLINVKGFHPDILNFLVTQRKHT